MHCARHRADQHVRDFGLHENLDEALQERGLAHGATSGSRG